MYQVYTSSWFLIGRLLTSAAHDSPSSPPLSLDLHTAPLRLWLAFVHSVNGHILLNKGTSSTTLSIIDIPSLARPRRPSIIIQL